jgi:hypothetical protein
VIAKDERDALRFNRPKVEALKVSLSIMPRSSWTRVLASLQKEGNLVCVLRSKAK